ncbi:MAG: carboxyl-terminal protease, partial [Proteobacteria bacterium]
MTSLPRILTYALLLAAMGGTAFMSGNDSGATAKVKNAEQYWASTGLQAEALEELLQPGSCKSSERYFLACANAVLSAAQKYGFDMTLHAELVPLVKDSKTQALTEKEVLA